MGFGAQPPKNHAIAMNVWGPQAPNPRRSEIIQEIRLNRNQQLRVLHVYPKYTTTKCEQPVDESSHGLTTSKGHVNIQPPQRMCQTRSSLITDGMHAHSVGPIGNRSRQNDDDLDMLLREGLRGNLRIPAYTGSTWARIRQRIVSKLRSNSTLEQRWAGVHMIHRCREPLSWNVRPDFLYLMPIVRFAL